MSFDVGADAYGRLMGRYAQPLAAAFVQHAGVLPGERVLDVGCGDPSESFVAAVSFMTDPVAGLAEMARVTRPGSPGSGRVTWPNSSRRLACLTSTRRP